MANIRFKNIDQSSNCVWNLNVICIFRNILDNLGLIKKSADNTDGNLDLNNPSLIRLKESLKEDSDYGSDDGQETASLASVSICIDWLNFNII